MDYSLLINKLLVFLAVFVRTNHYFYALKLIKMKFNVPSGDLLKKLNMVAGAIGSGNVLPILEDFLFDLSGNVLTITASDLETSIITTVEVTGEEDGKVAVPAKILLDTLKALPAQAITLTVNPENFGIELRSSYGKYKLAGEDGGDFPAIPQQEDAEDKVEVSSSSLNNAIINTLFATSNDELRPAMTGVYFQIDFNKIIFVATDAHKLVKFTLGEVTGEVNSTFIVPKKALNLLKNILPSGGSISISFNNANVFFAFEDTLLIGRQIDQRYPDYNAVIPVNNPNLLTANRSDLQNSMKRIAIYANKTTNQVVLNVAENSLTVSAQGLDFSNEATEQLPWTYEGDPLQIAFNAKFLIEMLSILDSDEIKLELSTPSRAGILLPSEQQDGEDILMLVMPVMLGN